MKLKSSAFTTQKDSVQNRPLLLLEIIAQFRGITQSNSTTTNIYLDNTASPNNDVYNGGALTITNITTHEEETQTINDYDGTTKMATCNTFVKITDTKKKRYEITNPIRFSYPFQGVTMDGVSYDGRGLAIKEITENAMGEIDNMDIGIDDTDQIMTYYANGYNMFRNNEVNLLTIFLDNLVGTPTDFIRDTFKVETSGLTLGMFQMNVKNAIARDIDVLPKRIWYRENCPWIYRDKNTCKYNPTSDSNLKTPTNELEDYCSKTLHGQYGCKFAKTVNGNQRKNVLNFGGAPTIPPKGQIIFTPSAF